MSPRALYREPDRPSRIGSAPVCFALTPAPPLLVLPSKDGRRAIAMQARFRRYRPAALLRSRTLGTTANASGARLAWHRGLPPRDRRPVAGVGLTLIASESGLRSEAHAPALFRTTGFEPAMAGCAAMD